MTTQLIRLTLLDGDPEGFRIASVAGRTTLLLACQWSQLKFLKSREEAKRPAVYFLVGTPLSNEVNSGFEQTVYIGECDSFEERFDGKHHKAESAEWSQIFLATTSEGTFNKAHARQAEHFLTERAKQAKRALILTQSTAAGKIDEGDAAFAQDFVANVIILSQTLGLSLFRSPVSNSLSTLQENAAVISTGNSIDKALTEPAPQFHFDYTNNKIDAFMVVDGAEFVIKKGSLSRAKDSAGLSVGLKEKRILARTAGILKKTNDPGFEEFTSDYPTKSSSTAGSMVYGSSCAGPVAWRHISTGQTYKEWAASQTEGKND